MTHTDNPQANYLQAISDSLGAEIELLDAALSKAIDDGWAALIEQANMYDVMAQQNEIDYQVCQALGQYEVAVGFLANAAGWRVLASRARQQA